MWMEESSLDASRILPDRETPTLVKLQNVRCQKIHVKDFDKIQGEKRFAKSRNWPWIWRGRLVLAKLLVASDVPKSHLEWPITFSSPQFNCLKDCISCELIDISHDDEKKCWHIPSCLHCKWQKWVRMGGRQQSWHQRCGPTTSGCSQGSWKEIWFLRLSFRLSVNTKQHFRC